MLRAHSGIALLSVLLLALLATCAQAETITSDGLLSDLDKNDRVTLTTADGAQREISVAEMQTLAEAQHKQQLQMQREKTGAQDDDGADNEPQWVTESVDEIAKSDPTFATHIALSQRGFKELQRHGYARGYSLTGFSEKEARDAGAKGKGKKKGDKKKSKSEDAYRVTLLLRAQRREVDTTASTGTRAQKRDREPLQVAYEVDLLLLHGQDHVSVMSAWELSSDEQQRAVRLSVQPSKAAIKHQQEHRQQQSKNPDASSLLWYERREDFATWILAGGVALIGIGLVVMYTSQRPGPITRKKRVNSADNWELVEDKKEK
ncbi:hypothetical protein FI667_g8738, partial [Globisporangium splendens]